MRKIFIYMLVLIGASLMANEIHWAKDYDSAMELATKENKPVMFVISRHTCKYCIILEETTFSDDRVINALNKDFISVISYTDEGDFIPRDLYQPGTPATWFLQADGEPMYQAMVGMVEPTPFLGGLVTVKNKFDKIVKNGSIK